jgi:hypothetical protein
MGRGGVGRADLPWRAASLVRRRAGLCDARAIGGELSPPGAAAPCGASSARGKRRHQTVPGASLVRGERRHQAGGKLGLLSDVRHPNTLPHGAVAAAPVPAHRSA